MDAGLRQILQTLQGEAAVYIELNYLLPQLRKRNLVTEEEFHYLSDERRNGSYERSKCLMSIIQTKGGEKSFDLFVKALQAEKQHTGHEHFAEELMKAKATLKNQLMRPEPPPRPKKILDPVADKSAIENLFLISKGIDDRLKSLEKDVREIKVELLSKSMEHKVGSVMETFQEKSDALTFLVQSINHGSYEQRDSAGITEMQYDDIHTHRGAVDNDYTENQYTPVIHKVPKAVTMKNPSPSSYLSLTTTGEQDERKYEKPVHVSQQKANYVEMNILAKGSTGEFWLAVNKIDRSKVVIKKPLETISSSVLGQEVLVLKCCQHPNIVKLITPLLDPLQSAPSLVFEYAGRGTLQKYLQNEKGSLSTSTLLAMAAGVACGMAELEQKGIIHCDLKARSILIDDDLVCRIASFSKALCLKSGETFKVCNSHRLAIRWQAPEILKDWKFSAKSDAWAFGVFLCEVFTHGSQPYPDMNADEVKQFVLTQKRMDKPNESFPKEVFALMKDCFQCNTARRPNFVILQAQLKRMQSKLHRTLSSGSEDYETDVELHRTQSSESENYETDAKKASFFPHLPTQEFSPLQATASPSIPEENLSSVRLLTRKEPEVNIFNLLVKTLSLVKRLDISGCNITDQGADLVAAIIHKAVSLKELDISYTNLNALKCNKISKALRSITSLQCFRMNSNFITDETALNVTAVVSSNCFMQELELSDNEISSVAMAQIIDTLSKSNTIKVLDISKNSISVDKIKDLSVALAVCHTLEILNLSQNSLLFTGVLEIAQAMRFHPSLKYLNFQKNIVSGFSECEFLVDVILSVNQSLLYLNVCGRNIRPRFAVDHMTPPCSHEKGSKFVIQNLYLSGLSLSGSNVLNPVRNPKKMATITQSDAITVIEKCPFNSDDVSSYYVDHNGNTIYNKAHNFAIVIPPGAVLQGESVQIQATASRFGPYQLPYEYYPISSFFWVSAHYTFNIPVYLVLSHHASPRDLDDIIKLHVVEACVQSVCAISDGKLIMSSLLHGVNFDYKIGYCVISTNHFCSYCLAKENITIPDEFHAFYYTFNYEGLLKAEVCMCHVNKECIEQVEKQYDKKKAKLREALLFSFTPQQCLTISVSPKTPPGWNMAIRTKKIHHKEFNFRVYGKETLQKMESIGSFPPRFVVSYEKIVSNALKLSSKVVVSTGTKDMTFQVSDMADPIQAGSAQFLPDADSSTILQESKRQRLLLETPKMCDLVTIVVPKVKAEWINVAYALQFKIPSVNAIKEKYSNDPKNCCRDVFVTWLSTEQGVSPKTWSTLLDWLKRIELTLAAEEIFEQLCQQYIK